MGREKEGMEDEKSKITQEKQAEKQIKTERAGTNRDEKEKKADDEAANLNLVIHVTGALDSLSPTTRQALTVLLRLLCYCVTVLLEATPPSLLVIVNLPVTRAVFIQVVLFLLVRHLHALVGRRLGIILGCHV